MGCSLIRSHTRPYKITFKKFYLRSLLAGAVDPRCKICILMGKAVNANANQKTPPVDDVHRQQTMILIPMDSPGVTVVRPLRVFGYDDAPRTFIFFFILDRCYLN